MSGRYYPSPHPPPPRGPRGEGESTPLSAPGRGRASGTLIGVGVGPGDPELITLKGAEAIRSADVIFAPTRRAGQTGDALRIAEWLVDAARQQVVCIPFPDEANDDGWRQACDAIAAALDGGQRGVFLVEGDPSLYSSFGHVAKALAGLAPWLRVEVVAGVSSLSAAAAAAGMGLADGGERVAILPANHSLDALEETLRAFESVVLIKVGPVLREVIEQLDRLGLVDKAIYVRRCGRPDQQVVHDLRSLASKPPRDYFALIIVRRSGA